MSIRSRVAQVASLGAAIFFVLTTASTAVAQADVWKGGSGNWSTNANWSTGKPPQAGQDALIDNGNALVSNVTVDLTAVCSNLTIDSDDSLTVGPVAGITINGTSITNSGIMTIASGNGLDISNNVSLSGGGTMIMQNGSRLSGGLNSVFTNVNNAVHGSGGYGFGQVQLINQSLIDANDPTSMLSVQSSAAGVTNTGTMQASNAGTLNLIAGVRSPFNNTGGIIQALNGSTVSLSGYTFTGGILTTSGTGVISTPAGGGNPFLNSLTNAGTYQILSAGSTTLQGTINNTGTINLLSAGGGTDLFISGNVTLKGAGSVIMSNNPDNFISTATGADTLVNQQTIQGAGSIGNGLPVTNQGTVNATSTTNPLIIFGPAGINTGTLEATGGATLQIQNTINNTGGTIQAQAGSVVLLAGGTVSGGTLTTSGTGTLQTSSGMLDGTVNIPTNAGFFKIANSGTLLMKGTINNTGTFSLDKTGGCLGLEGPTMLTGSGKVVMNGPGTCFLAFASSNTLTNSSTITGAGSIGDSNPMGITNNGTIVSTSTTSPLIIQPDVTGFTNNGKLTVNKGTVMNINGLFNNISAGTLTGGSYTVSGTLQLQNASITSNNASLTLIGAAAQIFNSFNSTNALAGLASIGNKGVLTLQNGQALTTTASTFSSAGKVTVTASSSFTLGGSYTQSANTTTVDGTLSAPAGFTLQKGTLQGQGTVASVVNSSATVTAGNSPTKAGKLTISGAYTQTSTGILNVAIGGTTVGTQYSQLGVSNGASLGGTLSIKLTNSFVPAIGNTFTILTGTAVTGQFATVKGTSINSGEHFQVNYTPTAVTLTVVSGP